MSFQASFWFCGKDIAQIQRHVEEAKRTLEELEKEQHIA
jgi:uncharacterized protein (UPF0216 family)